MMKTYKVSCHGHRSRIQQALCFVLLCSLSAVMVIVYLKIYSRPSILSSRHSPSGTEKSNGTLTKYHLRETRRINCAATPEIDINSSTRTILHEIPASYLKHLKVPRTYPECGSIFPWRLEGTNKYGNQGERSVNKFWFIILVKSAPQYMSRRNAIRNTWGSVEAIKGRLTRTVFVIAHPGIHGAKQEALVQENKLFGDLLQCNFVDSYKALPLKVLSMLSWVIEKDISAKFYVIADDDVILKVDKVHEFLSKKEAHYHEPHAYCGFELSSGSGPIRNPNHKWHMDNITYPGNIYPDYCRGAMYSLTRPMIKSVVCVASVTPYTDEFYFEDVLITGIFRELLNQGQSNLEDGGNWVEYFGGRIATRKGVLIQAWRKLFADKGGKQSTLKTLLQANGSLTRSFVMNGKIKDLELAWGKFKLG